MKTTHFSVISNKVGEGNAELSIRVSDWQDHGLMADVDLIISASGGMYLSLDLDPDSLLALAKAAMDARAVLIPLHEAHAKNAAADVIWSAMRHGYLETI